MNIFHICLKSDKNLLVTVSYDGYLRLFDYLTGEVYKIFNYEGREDITCFIEIEKDKLWITYAFNRGPIIKFWNFNSDNNSSLDAFNPNCNLIVPYKYKNEFYLALSFSNYVIQIWKRNEINLNYEF